MTRSISACARTRVRGEEYTAFVEEFVAAVQSLLPKNVCIQWEDFANINGRADPSRANRDKICTYNDDIQGTAGISAAGPVIFAALRITGQKNHRPAFAVPRRRLGPGPASPS